MRLQIKRGRPPRRMVGELTLAFEQKDFAVSGELVSRGSTRDTAAHDNEIVSIHSLRSAHATAERSRSFQQLPGQNSLMLVVVEEDFSADDAVGDSLGTFDQPP